MRGLMNRAVLAVMSLVVFVSEVSAATVYTDLTQFLAALSDYVTVDFEELLPDPTFDYDFLVDPTYTYSVGGYNGELSADDGFVAIRSGGGTKWISANSSPLVLTVKAGSLPTYAIGGFFATDDFFDEMTATIRIELDNGWWEEVLNNGSSDFIGIISSTPFSTAYISAQSNDPQANAYVTLDTLYVGSIVPLPAAVGAGFVLLGMVGVARWRGRLALKK